MHRKIILLVGILSFVLITEAQVPQPIRQFLNKKQMKGASMGFMAQEVKSGEILYAYDTDRQLIPASVMKLVTTATALEMLGEDFHYSTFFEYDGKISKGILDGNLYIKGSGDPTLGSSHFVEEGISDRFKEQNKFIDHWIDALKVLEIKEIKGSVIGDESVFDMEVTSGKWLLEDLGNWYGAGSHGITVFDNIYRLYLKSGEIGKAPSIIGMEPEISSLNFHNYLITQKVTTDSSYITGFPYSNDRYLHGIVAHGRDKITLRGDIPDPALFLAKYLTDRLKQEGIQVQGLPESYRQLKEKGEWAPGSRELILATNSPALNEIVRIINEKSHNLYADAVLKVMATFYNKRDKSLSYFGRGVDVVNDHWKQKGWDISSLWMYDGSGLAPTDKLTAEFICKLLLYMSESSPQSDAFIASLPLAGREGSVRNFLTGSTLQGKARIKSGSMSRVKAYAGYINKGEKQYAFALLVNNYSGDGRAMVKEIEKLLLALF